MANRRFFLSLNRHYESFIPSATSLQLIKIIPHLQTLDLPDRFHYLIPKCRHISTDIRPTCSNQSSLNRLFSSDQRDNRYDDDEDEDEEDNDVMDDDEDVTPSSSGSARVYMPEEKEEEAAAIGYKVIGPLERSDRVFKPYEPVFAVFHVSFKKFAGYRFHERIQIGSHQFKVSNGDCVYTEKLKHCQVNEKIILNKVLMLGTAIQTTIGRPILPDAAVHAVVEEHALDAKVIIFKKKRRKNYRRTKGHRQELTKVRITDIQGIEKPVPIEPDKPEKVKKVEKVVVAA